MNHEDAIELIESYAFGTLEADQARELEEHLNTRCEQCLARLREAGELSAKLAMGLPQADPPDRIERKLFDEINRGYTGKDSIWVRKLRIPSWAMAAAAVVILALGASQVILSYQTRNLKKQLVETSDVTALLNSPGMQFVDLKGVDPNPQAFGKVVMDPEKGAAVVYMYKLPQTPKGMEYQLWVMREGKPTSAGVFTVNPDGSAMIALNELDDPSKIASFLVTIEPEGGGTSPTGMMYLTGPDAVNQ